VEGHHLTSHENVSRAILTAEIDMQIFSFHAPGVTNGEPDAAANCPSGMRDGSFRGIAARRLLIR
jgi:hypothetical protein